MIFIDFLLIFIAPVKVVRPEDTDFSVGKFIWEEMMHYTAQSQVNKCVVYGLVMGKTIQRKGKRPRICSQALYVLRPMGIALEQVVWEAHSQSVEALSR